jgi:hypothetical protein
MNQMAGSMRFWISCRTTCSSSSSSSNDAFEHAFWQRMLDWRRVCDNRLCETTIACKQSEAANALTFAPVPGLECACPLLCAPNLSAHCHAGHHHQTCPRHRHHRSALASHPRHCCCSLRGCRGGCCCCCCC